MSAKLEALGLNLEKHLGERMKSKKLALGELTIEVAATDYLDVMQTLRDGVDLGFDEMIDLCGVCLLYTSPSPRDRTRSRMPSSA